MLINKKDQNRIVNEDGAALIISLLAMVLLTLVSSVSLTRVSTDITIGRNYKTSNYALYAADGGTAVGADIIKASILNGKTDGTTVPGFTTLNDTSLYGNEIISSAFNDSDAASSSSDVSFTLNNQTVNLDLDKTGQSSCPGSGMVFGGRTRGGGGGGLHCLNFKVDVIASSPVTGSQSNIETAFVCKFDGKKCL